MTVWLGRSSQAQSDQRVEEVEEKGGTPLPQ